MTVQRYAVVSEDEIDVDEIRLLRVQMEQVEKQDDPKSLRGVERWKAWGFQLAKQLSLVHD